VHTKWNPVDPLDHHGLVVSTFFLLIRLQEMSIDCFWSGYSPSSQAETPGDTGKCVEPVGVLQGKIRLTIVTSEDPGGR